MYHASCMKRELVSAKWFIILPCKCIRVYCEDIYELLSVSESMKMRSKARTASFTSYWNGIRSAVNSMAIFVCAAVREIHFRVNACEKTVKAGLTSVDLTAMPLYKCWHAEQFQDISQYYSIIILRWWKYAQESVRKLMKLMLLNNKNLIQKYSLIFGNEMQEQYCDKYPFEAEWT